MRARQSILQKSKMWRSACLSVILGAALVGCGGSMKDGKNLVNMMPAGQPQMAGTWDFDLLDSVVGTGCAEKESGVTYTASTAGTTVGAGFGLVAQAESAAIFDAIGKVKGADTLFVSRTLSEGDTTSKVCTTVFGRAIRLKKGPTPLLTTPALAAEKTKADSALDLIK